ncbi:MAG: HAD-IA family hydrolase [Elusimicrobiaceae bacterium]|nr:HAD-IA family hydrolase [Elusimicrobiaceae bacterium]
MFEELKNLVDAHRVISFDIFDTLVCRTYDKPIDLFKHIEVSKGIKNFQRLRQTAEAKARQKVVKNGADETTLDEIYNELPAGLLPLKDIEIAQEINVCFQDKYMHDVFTYAKAQKKKIIITSDMYLPKETIEAILRKNGYAGYDKLFLSSDIKLNKASGRLFAAIIKELKCKPTDILHIGDNQVGDYEAPSQLGIDCWLYETAKKINARQETKRFMLSFTEHCDEIPVSIAKSLVLKRNFARYDAWENFGYKYAGLMLYGYCFWLYNQFKNQDFSTIVFASRDGYIPMQIFQKYHPEFAGRYFYASRRAYIFSGMKEVDDVFLTYLVDLAGAGLTFGAYWDSLKIDDEILTRKFKETFDLSAKITDSDRDNLKRFFISNKKDLFRYAQKERQTAITYFEQVGLLDKGVAFVDIGWRGSIQRSVVNTIRQAKKKNHIRGFYLATHPLFKKKEINANAFLMNENKPDYMAQIINPVISVFELICSAPHLGCLKIVEKNGQCVPLEQEMNPVEKARIEANKRLTKGVFEFIEDFKQVTENLPLEISPLACVIPFIHFFNALNKETEKALSSVGYVTGIGDVQNYVSMVSHFEKEKTIGVVYTWPGSLMNAEGEFLNRLKIAASNIGYKTAVFSKAGHILDENYCVTPQVLSSNDLNFIINIHYEDFKCMDAFTYKALWNPPCIPLQYPVYPSLLRNIISNDDFLIYDDGGMSEHLQAMLIDTPRDLKGASSLTASFPKTAVKKPNLTNPTLFYCGVNWEKMIGTSPRHEGLFQLLDKLDNVCLYGPKSGWVGYKNYKGSIPFDGFSLVEEAHKCGVVLALSSDYHYRAGAATNRVYEGCAAGAVIISDTNRFIKKHFGDSILYIDFDKDHPEHMFNQIKEHLEWIKNNKEEALKLAQKAQKIFLEKFTLEKQLMDIINNHENRKKAVARALYARNNQTKTLAVCFIDTPSFTDRDKELLENTLGNIDKQIDKNITLAVCCEKKIETAVRQYINTLPFKVSVSLQAYPVFDKFNYKWLSRGQMLFDVIRKIPHDYLCVLDGHETLFQDHLTTLKRTLEDHPDKIAAYSGTFLDSQDTNRYRLLNNPIKPKEIYDCWWPDGIRNVSGMFLLNKRIENQLADYIVPYVDGLEVALLINKAYFKDDEEFIYSQRMTCGCNESLITGRPVTIARSQQINFIHGMVHNEYQMKQIHVERDLFPTMQAGMQGLYKKLLIIYKVWLQSAIECRKTGLLFAWEDTKRAKVRAKIQALKEEREQIKHKIKTM